MTEMELMMSMKTLTKWTIIMINKVMTMIKMEILSRRKFLIIKMKIVCIEIELKIKV